MDFCFNCGTKTDPDWVFCRSCGSALEDTNSAIEGTPVPTSSGMPKVELISRGWDVIDVETVETPDDPLQGDIETAPLPAGAIEIAVDDISIIETASADETEEEEEGEPADPWDHLRPHGELPPLRHAVSRPGRVGQGAMLLTALSALASAGIHFYMNTQLDAYGNGATTASAVNRIGRATDISLIAVAGLALLGGVALLWWFLTSRPTADFRPGKGGLVALLCFFAGTGIIGGSFLIPRETITEAIGANTLIVLGLGLLMASCLAVVRTVERIDLREPA